MDLSLLTLTLLLILTMATIIFGKRRTRGQIQISVPLVENHRSSTNQYYEVDHEL